MKKVKITVLKATYNEEIANELGGPRSQRICAYKPGESWIADFRKPEGLCDEAWKAIHPFAFALAHGAKDFYYSGWNKEPGTAVVSCPDGFRPVIFKLEATDIEATPDN
jgi:hypothetical protein